LRPTRPKMSQIGRKMAGQEEDDDEEEEDDDD